MNTAKVEMQEAEPASSPHVSTKIRELQPRSSSQGRCQADGCRGSLKTSYQRKIGACEEHLRAWSVMVAGIKCRFCQQCARFQDETLFDNGKRSCRARLMKHNARRRCWENAPDANNTLPAKRQPKPTSTTATTTTTTTTTTTPSQAQTMTATPSQPQTTTTTTQTQTMATPSQAQIMTMTTQAPTPNMVTSRANSNTVPPGPAAALFQDRAAFSGAGWGGVVLDNELNLLWTEVTREPAAGPRQAQQISLPQLEQPPPANLQWQAATQSGPHPLQALTNPDLNPGQYVQIINAAPIPWPQTGVQVPRNVTLTSDGRHLVAPASFQSHDMRVPSGDVPSSASTSDWYWAAYPVVPVPHTEGEEPPELEDLLGMDMVADARDGTWAAQQSFAPSAQLVIARTQSEPAGRVMDSARQWVAGQRQAVIWQQNQPASQAQQLWQGQQPYAGGSANIVPSVQIVTQPSADGVLMVQQHPTYLGPRSYYR